MAEFVSRKMKRKAVEDDMFDALSDFPLSAPASKIRRLDHIVPIPEVEPEFYNAPEHRSSVEPTFGMEDDKVQSTSNTTEVGLPVILNEERALVLYKPVNSPSYLSLLDLKTPVSADISYAVDSNIITSLKGRPNVTSEQGRTASLAINDSLAVVPWVSSSRFSSVAAAAAVGEESEPMEAEYMETDMQEDTVVSTPASCPASVGIEGLQWQRHYLQSPLMPSIMSSW